MSRRSRKKSPPKTRSDKKAKAMVRNRLGTETPLSPTPEGYQTWADYFKTNNNPPQPYKSWFEYRMFNEGCLRGTPYEATKVSYTTEPKKRSYTPDGDKGNYMLELKGRFRTPAEAAKYIDIAKSNPDKILIFIFSEHNVKMPNAKARKDGTTRTQEEWAEANNFLYTHEDSAEEFLRRLV